MPKYINGIKVDPRLEDQTGKRVGRLVVKSLFGRNEGRRGRPWLWLCECDCGNEVYVCSAELVSGDTKSCGCLKSESSRERQLKHGYKGTKEYLAWKRIKDRVFNKNCTRFEAYSALGMDEDMAEDFFVFIADIGDIPEDLSGRVSVDRIDNTKGYTKGNIRWANDEHQARNKGMYSNNSSGVTGVYNQQGKYWVASWYVAPKKQKSRYFSIKKYGEELAFFAACECRELAIMRLNLLGAGYTENHGK